MSGNVTVYGSDVGLYSVETLTILGTGATFDVTCSNEGQAAIAFNNGEIVIPDVADLDFSGSLSISDVTALLNILSTPSDPKR